MTPNEKEKVKKDGLARPFELLITEIDNLDLL